MVNILVFRSCVVFIQTSSYIPPGIYIKSDLIAFVIYVTFQTSLILFVHNITTLKFDLFFFHITTMHLN